MEVWAGLGLGQLATVAQLVGVDAGGLISKILQAAATARENKKECEQLAHRVSMIAELLPHLHDPDNAIMRRPLTGLDDALRDAHELVVSCQRRSAAYRFVMAGRQAGRFRRVQSRIDSYLMVFPVISHIAITRRLDRMHTVQLPNPTSINVPPPPVSQLVQDQIIGAEEVTLASSIAAPPSTCSLAIDTALGAGDTGVARRLANKRLKIGRRKGEQAVSKEVAAVSTGASPFLPHKHVVRVFRRCVVEIEKRFRRKEGRRELLVSEYTNNGTLEHHLHLHGGRSSSSPVMTSWKTRVEVLLGASRAIEHLHCRHSQAVHRHRRVSSCNILLDASWTPRVSDLGASVTSRHETNEELECLKPASDVYNLGVVMLEVLTGKHPVVTNLDEQTRLDEQSKSEVATSLVCFALPFIEAGELAEVLDRRPAPPTRRQLEALEQVAQTAARCLRFEVEDRPPISDVVANLDRALKLMCS